MNVELTADQREFVRRAIESGRLTTEEDAIREGLELWEERERRRIEILAMLDEADVSLARGEGIPITDESMKALDSALESANTPDGGDEVHESSNGSIPVRTIRSFARLLQSMLKQGHASSDRA